MKNRRLSFIFICFALPACLLALLCRPAGVTQATERLPTALIAPVGQLGSKYDGVLQEKLAESEPDSRFPVIIHMGQKANLAPASLAADATERRRQVVTQLQAVATASQAGLRQQLDQLQAAGDVSSYQSFWIFNGMGATVNRTALEIIAARPDVGRIEYDVRHQYVPNEPEQVVDVPDQVVDEPEQVLMATQSSPWGIEKIGAPYVWSGLGIDGTGVTVAIMDTGVDWEHPILANNYRGAGSSNHATSWFDTVAGEPVPLDPHGHGTHVTGTSVGDDGIGVAPGADWIAVRIFNEYGYGTNSDIHEGFQWLLAPGGDPALAPDIVNNSWGGTPGTSYFEDDLAAMDAAGIITVFAAGNAGPSAETVGSPADNPGVLAVGASDDVDETTWFSSRGPSSLTGEVKPTLVAPGAYIYSSLPNGTYGYYNGTSMAAPHVTGGIALLLSANPALDHTAVTHILTTTAVAVDAEHPNSNNGWGRLDLFAAVAPQVSTGTLVGSIKSNDGTPLPGVAITITTPAGSPLHYRTGSGGTYEARLQPGTYQVAVAPFGYNGRSIDNIQVIAGQTVYQNVTLLAGPTYLLDGIISSVASLPPGGVISVVGTPVTTTLDSRGGFSLRLPAGQYTLRAAVPGHRLGHLPVEVAGDGVPQVAMTLETAPSILLVDSARHYYSALDYYQAALEAAGFQADVWRLRNPFDGGIPYEVLWPYDIVIWAAPYDSPGSMGTSEALATYLDRGGNLFISGQNLARIDDNQFPARRWWEDNVDARFRGKVEPPIELVGPPESAFSGISLTLNGPDSADNQVPDRVTLEASSSAEVAMRYADGTIAGLQIGQCETYRLVYLGFGLEGVPGNANRAELLTRGLHYLTQPPQGVGGRFFPAQIEDFALPGQQLTYTLTLRNDSETESDTFAVSLNSPAWPASVEGGTVTLAPCRQATFTVTVTVPDNVPPATHHTLTVTAVSQRDPAEPIETTVHHWTPGHVLLVDDDRWYNREAAFQEALDTAGIYYDTWDIGWDNDVRGSPPAEILAAYDIVLWYTGYDWYAPVTAAELGRLQDYLEQGGRLLLSSQDFLYYHSGNPFSKSYLGVLAHQGEVTPTVVYGGPTPGLMGNLPGPFPLYFPPYINDGDTLWPAEGSQPILWHELGVAAVATAGPDWRTIFAGIPLETLPQEALNATLNRMIGWLGDLGDSSFTVDRVRAAGGEELQYTLILRNNGPSNQVVVTNDLPAALSLNLSSINGGAVYDVGNHRLTWQGILPPGGVHQISYRATPSSAATERLDNAVSIHYDHHDLRFERVARTWINAPDLTPSRLQVNPNPGQPGLEATYTLLLRNDGPQTAETVTATLRLPDGLQPSAASLYSNAGQIGLSQEQLIWTGRLQPGETVTVSLRVLSDPETELVWFPLTAVLEDGVSDVVLLHQRHVILPWRRYLPVVGH